MLLLIIIAGCFLLAFLNYRYWKLMPDDQDNEGAETEYQHEVNEYGNPPVQPHYKVPTSHKVNYLIDWIIILVIAVGVVLFIVNLF